VLQPHKLDRFMQRVSRQKLQGSALHNYREHFKPTPDSYDHDNDHQHATRLLLKAEPQSGKTGTSSFVSMAFIFAFPTVRFA